MRGLRFCAKRIVLFESRGRFWVAGSGRIERYGSRTFAAVGAFRAIGDGVLLPHALCLLAEACGEAGRLDDGFPPKLTDIADKTLRKSQTEEMG
jgi:hypothetical protein